MKVLWLVSWYPGKTHATNGDFTERQAKALSLVLPVTVLFVTKDESLAAGSVVMDKTNEGNLTVYRVYYAAYTRWHWVEKLLSLKRFIQLQRRYIHLVMAEQGRPDVVHVQVAMKAGIGAHYLKKTCKIPYVVTEHWTGYYPQSSDSLYSRDILFKKLNKQVLQHATAFLPVSAHLGQTVNKYFLSKPFTVVPNVVDTSLFFYTPGTPQKFRFIHPSYLNYQKNPEGILAACKLAVDAGCEFELLFVGRQDAALVTMATNAGLMDGVVRFMPAQAYTQVAKLMQASSALLLFSRFENLPCVVLEALCCGLPVVSTNVGGLPEVIDDTNGILVPNENITALATAMQQMVNNYAVYNRSAIAEKAAMQYSYMSVAAELMQVYKTVGAAI
jgi:glycosyltransferase involved in cell wall biosynthesis